MQKNAFKGVEEKKTLGNQNAQKTGRVHTSASLLNLEDESKIKSRSDTGTQNKTNTSRNNNKTGGETKTSG